MMSGKSRWGAIAMIGVMLCALSPAQGYAAPSDAAIAALKEDAVALELGVRATERARRAGDLRRVDVYVVLDDARFELRQLAVRLSDEEAVHDYDAVQAHALAARGAHRVLRATLPPGRYPLEARFSGRFAGGAKRAPPDGTLRTEVVVGAHDLQVSLPLRRVSRDRDGAQRAADVRVDSARYLIGTARYYEALALLAEIGVTPSAEIPDDARGWLLAEALIGFGMRARAMTALQALPQASQPELWARLLLKQATIDHRRGAPDQALALLDRIGDAGSDAQQQRARALRSLILLERGDYAMAAELLANSEGLSAATRLNRAIALDRSGDRAAADAALRRLISGEDDDAVARALRDRARLFHAQRLFERRDDRAVAALLADGAESTLYQRQVEMARGWAAFAPADAPQTTARAAVRGIEQAMAHWRPLREGPISDDSVQEATVAIPFAYRLAGQRGDAYAGYQRALQVFEQVNAGLLDSERAVRSGQMVETMLRADSDLSGGADWELRHLVDVPEANWLLGFLSTHRYQEAFRRLRELRLIAHAMAHHVESLAAHRDSGATALQGRALAVGERSRRLASEQSAHIEGLLLAEIQRQRAHIRTRLAEVRLALAQLYEGASVER